MYIYILYVYATWCQWWSTWRHWWRYWRRNRLVYIQIINWTYIKLIFYMFMQHDIIIIDDQFDIIDDVFETYWFTTLYYKCCFNTITMILPLCIYISWHSRRTLTYLQGIETSHTPSSHTSSPPTSPRGLRQFTHLPPQSSYLPSERRTSIADAATCLA